MKKFILLIVFASALGNVFGGTFYWVGASGGSWATTANWSSTTSGVYTAVGAAPTTGDNVYFDGIKSTGTVGSPASTTYTDMSVALGAATTITGMTVSSGGTITFTAAFTLTMTSSLTFSGGTKLSCSTASNGFGFTLGNGSAFTLTGNNSSNYFDGNTNTYFTFNTTSPLTVYFNPAASTAYGALVPTKGLITLGTSVSTSRLTFGANGSNLAQGLALNGNTLTISGGNSHTFNQQSNCSAIDASAAGSKVIITASAPSLLYQGGNIFKPGATIDYLEFNSSGNIFTLFNPITVNTLKLTAGSINNTYNNITVNTAILKGGANNGNLLTAPVYGGTVAVTTSASSTCGNELLGTSGKVGTLAVNDGVTYTLSGNGVTSYSLTNCGLGYATAPSVAFNTPTNGTAATGTAVVQGGVVVGINITNPGVGYTSTPTVTIANAPAYPGSFSAWTNKSYVVGDLVTNSNNLYACVSAGTSTTAPTGTTQSQTPAGGTSKWSYLCGSWTASTAYSVGVTCINNSNLYLCISTNGSSAASGGPSGTGSSITDGSILWKYLGSCSGLSPVNASATATYNSINSLTVDNLTIGTGTSGIVNYPNNPTALTLNVNQNVTVSAGATLAPVTQTNSIIHLLKIGGNLTNSGTFTTSVTNGKLDVTMNGTGAQSINSAITFNGLTISNTAAAVSTSAALNTTNLTIDANAVLNMQTNALSTVTTTSGAGKLQTQATAAAVPASKTWTFNVEYNNATGGQSVIGGTYTGGLTMSNTSGINTAAANLTIGNALTLNTGSTFLLPNGISITSGTGFTGSTGAGTLQTADNNSVAYRIPRDLTWSGKVQYTSGGNNRIVPSTYNDLDVDNGTAGTINWGSTGETGTIKINGTLSTVSTQYGIQNSTVEFGGTNQAIPRMSAYNVKLSGAGTTFPSTYLYIANNFDPGSITSATQGTIIFNGTANNQTIPAFTYYNLQLNNTNTNGNGTLTGNVTVNNVLTLQAGTLITGSNSLSLKSSTSVTSGAIDAYLGTIEYNGSAAQTIAGILSNSLNNLTINNSAGVTAPTTLTVNGLLTLTSGILNNTSKTLTPTSIVKSGGSLSAIPTFGSSVNLTYNGTSTKGNEFPAADIINTLTVNNTTGITLTDNRNIPNLSIANSSSLTVSAGKQLTVSTSMTNNGTLNLLSSATILTPSSISGSGTTNVSQFISGGRNWYLSSPVTGANATTVLGTSTATTKPSAVVWYDETKGSTTPWTTETSTLVPTRGYIFASSVSTPSTDGTITFSGTLNKGDITTNTANALTLSSTGVKDGFNLVGNPYASYVDWNQLTKTNLNSTMWYRTNEGGTYKFYTYNGTSAGYGGGEIGVPANVTNMIPPLQGFWVRCEGGVGSIGFTNANRAHLTGTNPLKAPASKKSVQQVLRLQVSNGTNNDETVIYFNPNASNGFDSFDSPKMSNANVAIPEIYTTIGTEQLVINGMNNIPENKEIALGFTPGSATSFSIRTSEFANFETGTSILLKDYATGMISDITNGSAYSFAADNSVPAANRFTLLFKVPSLTTDISGKNGTEDTYNYVRIHSNAQRQIIIDYLDKVEGQESFSVYNTLGQELVTGPITQQTSTINKNLNIGTYLVKVKNCNRFVTKKVVIN